MATSDDSLSSTTKPHSAMVQAFRSSIKSRSQPSPRQHFVPRCQTAPAMAFIDESGGHSLQPNPSHTSISSLVRAFLLIIIYLLLGMSVYLLNSSHFTGNETNPLVDSFYYSVATLCTVGYGDITPTSTTTKLFAIVYVLVRVVFVSLLLSIMLNHLLDLREGHLLKSKKRSYGKSSCLVDEREDRLKIRINMVLSLLAVFVFVVVGVLFMHYVESLGWIDSLYLTVISVTTVGYGDHSFKSIFGRLFGSIWLLLSTLAVVRAFLCLAELTVDKKNREMTRRILDRNLSLPQFLDPDLDQSRSERKSEFILYKLKEMGKHSEEDIRLIGQKFDQLGIANLKRANHRLHKVQEVL